MHNNIRMVYSKFKHFLNMRSKIFFLFLMSYILIFAIPVITTFFICGNYQRTLTNEYKQKTDNFIETVSLNTDSSIKNIRKLYSYIITHEDINDIMKLSTTGEYNTSKNVKNFLNSIYFFSTNDFDSYFIYMKDSDTILAENAICSSDYYYKSIFSNGSLSYEDWLSNITSPESHLTSYYADDNKNLKMIYHISYTNNDGKTMSLCALTDDKIFMRGTSITEDLAECSVFISDISGNILLYNTNIPQVEGFSNINDVKENVKRNCNFTSKRIYVGATPIYISVVSPRSFHIPIIRQTLKFSISFIILCLLLCLVLIVYFCTKHYAPISEFIRLFGEHTVKNEYDYIQKSIEHILSENMFLSDQMNSFEKKQRNHILSKYITNSYSPHYIEAVFKSNNITFQYKHIAVCGFQFVNPNELYPATPGISEEDRYRDLLFIIDNVFSDLFNTPGYSCDIVDVAGYVFCIINTSDTAYEINKIIENTINFGIDFIYDNFNLKLSYAVSNLTHTPYEFSIACSETLYLLNYKNMFDIEQPLFYSCYNSLSSTTDNYFSTELEQTLVNYLSNGQEDKSLECINEIFANLKAANLPLDRIKCILIYICFVLLKIPGITISDEEQTNLFSMFFSTAGSLSDMKKVISSIIANICEQINSQTGMYKNQRIKKLAEYIDENFADPKLCLAYIGSEFHLDASYLSKQFKDYMGVSIVNYINELRINKAKEIMDAGTTESVEKIAQDVGYNSIRTFNRLFEKAEGISPATYKKSRI